MASIVLFSRAGRVQEMRRVRLELGSVAKVYFVPIGARLVVCWWVEVLICHKIENAKNVWDVVQHAQRCIIKPGKWYPLIL